MKKKGERKVFYMLMFSILVAIFLISLVSAGVLDWFKKTITGKVPQNMSISVAGINPAQITYVSVPSRYAVILTTIPVIFEVHMYDADGVSDLNDVSVSANFTKTGETPKLSGPCSWINDINAYAANYSCSIDMNYWDADGIWNVGVQGVDLGNLTYQHNTTTTFNYGVTRSMDIYPNPLIWPSITSGANNQKATTPLTINNSGNYDGIIQINALDLLGADLVGSITADKFNISIADDCFGTTLNNGTFTNITNSNSNPGNLAGGGGKANLYYCIPLVPSISSQEYSTRYGGSWEIKYP